MMQESTNSKPVRQQFADTMLEIGERDPELVVVVGDISHFSLQPFAKACPGRYYNIGICEPATLSIAAGLSKAGLCPVVHTIAPFLIERGFEQIKLDFCYQQQSGNIVTTGSAFDYANLGCTHHCYGDFALLKTLPRVRIFYPASAPEFHALFVAAYREPFVNIFRMPTRSHKVTFDARDIQPGKAIVVATGKGASVVAVGPQLQSAVQAREQLLSKGFELEVVYVPTIRPLDEPLIRSSVSKTKRVLVVEEHMRSGGLGDDVLRLVHEIPGFSFSSLSIPDSFVTGYGTYDQHCAALGLTAEGIIERVTALGWV